MGDRKGLLTFYDQCREEKKSQVDSEEKRKVKNRS